MEMNINKYSEDEVKSTVKGKAMTIDESSKAMIFNVFTEGLYSDPIGSVIREITSNCFDSHIEANKDTPDNPVVVELRIDGNQHNICFIDKGIGMSPYRIEHIYGSYFKSTKRSSNDLIGGFGLGGKTPLAYVESFTVTTVSEKENDIEYCNNEIKTLNKKIQDINTLVGDNDLSDEQLEEIIQMEEDILDLQSRIRLVQSIKEPKIKYIYSILKGDESPVTQLLNREHLDQFGCDEPNGTEVCVPIKVGDVNEFKKQTLRQLYYFENIVFRGFDEEGKVTNNYKIFKGKNYLYRGNDYMDGIHACYGKVAYPLDYSVLGLDYRHYKIPIALKFDIGELEGTGVNSSRESLKYTQNNIKTIKKKINDAVAEVTELLINQYETVETLEEYYNAKRSFGRLKFDDTHQIFLHNFISLKDVKFSNFKYKNLSYIPKEDTVLKLLYDSRKYGRALKKRENKWELGLSDIMQYNVYYSNKYSATFRASNIKNQYLRSISPDDFFYVITKKDVVTQENIESTFKINDKSDKQYSIIDENSLTKEQEQKLIYEFIGDVHALTLKKSTDEYEIIEVPEDYVLERKQEKIDKSVLNAGIPVNEIVSSFDANQRKRIQFSQLLKLRGKIYYGFNNDIRELQYCYDIFGSISKNRGKLPINQNGDIQEGTIFIGISKQNEKYMELLGKKAIHVKHFVKTYVYKNLDRLLESRLISQYRSKLYNHSSSLITKMKVMNICGQDDLYNQYNKLKQHLDSFDTQYFSCNLSYVTHKLGVQTLPEVEFEHKEEFESLIKTLTDFETWVECIQVPWRFSNDPESYPRIVELIKFIFDKLKDEG